MIDEVIHFLSCVGPEQKDVIDEPPPNSLGMWTGLANIMASPNQAMKRLAGEGAVGVPTTAPNVCWNSSPSISNTVFLRT